MKGSIVSLRLFQQSLCFRMALKDSYGNQEVNGFHDPTVQFWWFHSMRLEESMSHRSSVFQSTRRAPFLVIAGIISFAFLFPHCTPTPRTTEGKTGISAGTGPIILKSVG